MDLPRAETLLHEAQELVDTIQRIVDRMRTHEAVSSLPDVGTRRLPWRPILNRTAREHGLTVAGLLKGRRQDVVDARREAYAALRSAGYNYCEIGRFCNRDRTSVMHALGVTK